MLCTFVECPFTLVSHKNKSKEIEKKDMNESLFTFIHIVRSIKQTSLDNKYTIQTLSPPHFFCWLVCLVGRL